ncbi:MAG: hypothetical protein IPK00_11580 [Deltaproteobacteria bacterium]|nr:hypothetical protein [Deltaproteobacteria bacterium]
MMLRNAAAALTTLFFAQSALALDGIDLSEPVAAPAAGECPQLVRIKYPFLTCAGGDGSRELLQARPTNPNPTWAATRQIPQMSDWTESDGAFGPDQNQD